MNKVEFMTSLKSENYKCYVIDENNKLFFNKNIGYVYKENSSGYGIRISTSDELLEITNVKINKELLDEIDAFKMIEILSEE